MILSIVSLVFFIAGVSAAVVLLRQPKRPQAVSNVGLILPHRSLERAQQFVQDIEYKDIELSAGTSSHNLQFRVQPDEGCGVSDLDPILNDLNLAGESKLTLSIEGLFPSASERWSFDIEVKELAKGLNLSLPVLPTAVPLYAGLFLCRDRQGSGCLSKEIGGYERLTQNHISLSNSQNELKSFAQREKIYFFAPLVLGSKAISIFDTHTMFVDGSANFAAELQRVFGYSDEVQQQIKQANKLIKATGLGAIQLKDSRLLVQIPTTKSGCFEPQLNGE
jgi:hypothetical protein